ncbi:MAG: pilus assembly protein [Anaerolineae bacterium]
MPILASEEGQGLTEYALLILFIAIVVVVVLILLGPAAANLYQIVVDNWPPG